MSINWLNKYPEDHIVVLDASEHLVRSYHETGIRDTLEWYIENVQWWRNLQKKA